MSVSAPLTAKEEILGRIRAALPGVPLQVEASYANIRREYRRDAELDREQCLELFVDRLVDYDADVVQVSDEAGLVEDIAQVLERAGEERLVVAEGFPRELLPSGVQLMLDQQLSTSELDSAQVVLTSCEAAVASTGTIFLVHGGAQGRRAITLLPDHHVCLVRRSQVYGGVPEALAAIAAFESRPITSISGPSATSDIEMTRIRGVHGPRRLTVLLYGDAALRPSC